MRDDRMPGGVDSGQEIIVCHLQERVHRLVIVPLSPCPGRDDRHRSDERDVRAEEEATISCSSPVGQLVSQPKCLAPFLLDAEDPPRLAGDFQPDPERQPEIKAVVKTVGSDGDVYVQTS